MSEAVAGPRPSPPGAVEPFYFGPPESPLFGCLHAASGTRLGVVVCYPMSHEYIALHRASRLLATQVSRAGTPVLRFDYQGTGDSAGDLTEARLARWVENIRAAADELKRRAGCSRICLVGMRLGASLATSAAIERPDVEHLVLWDPVIHGKRYLRELARDTRRMLLRAHVRPKERISRRRPAEVLGFPLPAPLADDLSSVDLGRLEESPARRVLLIESTAESPGATVAATMRALGARVDSVTEPFSGLWQWQEDVTRIQLPHSIIRWIAQWIAKESV